MAKRLNYQIGISADTKEFDANIKTALQSLQALGAASTNQLTKELQEASQSALQLGIHLKNATSQETGKLNLTDFNNSLKRSGVTLEDYVNKLSQLGSRGDKAFLQVAKAITSAELPLKRSTKLLDELWVTMKNTARWQLSSSVLQGFTGALQTAYGYAKDLNESLNNIRIVTGKNIDEMAKYAEQANKAASALSTTTTDYTNASLIYYQQGLSEQEVQERTEATIKFANVSRQSAETASEQLTSIWNNFADGSKSLEYYIDVMTRLGAETASSSEEISEGVQKFAATADTIGLSYEYAASALATVTATTRQSADVVGTAFKTLFARIQGLSLGETLDDGTTMTKYSDALNKVGISIFDQNNQLKEMDTLLDEMGNKWGTLSKDQQVALAQTVAGVRQYTQLIALMDNWDFFQENLASAYDAEGTLSAQAEIYAESWEAARDRVAAATENVADSLINDEFFIDLDNAVTPLINGVATVVDAFGGLGGTAAVVGNILLKVYGDKIASSMRDLAVAVGLTTGKEQERLRGLQATAAQLTQNLNLMAAQSTDSYRSAELQMMASEVELNNKINNCIEQKNSLEKETIQLKLQEFELSKQNVEVLFQELEAKRQSVKESLNTLQTEKGFDETALGDAYFKKKGAKDKRQDLGDVLGINLNDKGLKNFKSLFKESNQGFNLIIDKLTEIKVKSAGIKTFSKAFEAADKDVSKLSTNMKKLGQEIGLLDDQGKEIGNIEDEIQRLAKTSENAGASTKILRDALVAMSNGNTGAVDAYIQKLEELGINGTEARASLEGLLNAQNSFDPTAVVENDWANSLVKVSQGLMQVTMGINAVKSLGSVFSDDDMSAGEKFITLLTAMSTLLPLVASVTKALNIEKQISVVVQGAENTVTVAGVSAKLTEIILKKMGKTATDADTAATIANTAAKYANNLILLAIIAAITILVALVSALAKAIVTDTEAAAQAADAAQNLADAYNECKQEYEDMIAAMKEYQTARDGLDSLTEGTEEYKEALKEANRQALELIKTYHLIEGEGYSWDGDKINITDDTLIRVQREQESKVDQAYAASSIADIEAQRANTKVKQNDLATQLYEPLTYAIQGMNDQLSREYQAAVDQAWMTGIDASTIDLPETITENYSDYINKALEKAGEDSSIFDSEEALAEALDIDLDTPLASIVYSLMDFKDDIIEIDGELNDISLEEAAQAQATAREIMSETRFDKTEAGAMALEAGGRLYSQAQGELYDQYLEEAKSRAWIFGGQNEASGEAFDRYAELAGLTGLTNFKATNFKSDGTIEYEYYEDGEKQKKTVTAQEIAATLAAADASEQFKIALEGLRGTIEDLNKSADEASHAFAEFLSTGNLEGATRGEFNALKDAVNTDKDKANISDEELDAYLGFTDDAEENLAKAQSMGYETAEAYREAFRTALEVDWEGLVPEGLGKDISDKLSLGAAQSIRNTFKDLGEEGGQAFLDAIEHVASGEDWEALAPEDQTALLNDLANIDWTSWDAGEQAIDIAQRYDIAIDGTSEKWQEYVARMRDASNALPDLKALGETFKQISEITKDIDLGSILSSDDYNLLVEYNGALEDYFAILSDGSAQFIGDKLDFQQTIEETNRQQLEDGIASYRERLGEIAQQQVAGSQAVGGIENLGKYQQDQYYYDSEDKNSNVDYLYKGDNVKTQLEFLKSQGYDTSQWENSFSEDGTTDIGNLQSITEAVNEASAAYNELGTEAVEIQGLMQGAMNEIALSAEDAEARLQFLVENTSNETDIDNIVTALAAYNKAFEAAHQQEKWEGMDPDEVEDYADSLMDAAESSDLLHDSLKDNEEAAEDVALYTKKMNQGIEKLSEGFEDWSDVLNNSDKSSEEYSEAMTGMKDAMSDVLGVSEDFLSDGFILDNMEDIKLAAEGDAEAIDRLAAAAGKDILVNIGIQDEGLQEELLSLHDNLVSQIPDIKVGATLESGDFLAQAAQIVEAAGMSVEQANAYFRSLGFEANFETKTVPVTRQIKGTEQTTKVLDWETVNTPDGGTQTYPSKIITTTKEIDLGTVTEDMEVPALTTDGGEPNFTLTRTNAGAMNNFSSSNSGGGKSSGGGGGGGGGGGDSAGTKKAKGEKKNYKDVADRYHEITRAIQRQVDVLDDLDHQLDRTYGVKRLDAFKSRLAELEKQSTNELAKLKEAEGYLAQDKATVDDMFGGTAQYGANGEILNYEELLKQTVDEYNNDFLADYNAFIDEYNTLTKNGQEARQEEYDSWEERKEEAEERQQEQLDALAQYEETLDVIQEQKDAWEDLQREMEDLKLEEITYNLEVTLDIKNLKDAAKEFSKAIVESFGDELTHGAASMAISAEQAQLDMDMLPTYMQQYEELKQRMAEATEFTDVTAIVDAMENLQSEIIGTGENLLAFIDQVETMLPDALDAAADRFAEFIDQLDHNKSIIGTTKELLALQGVSYKTAEGFALLQRATQEELDASLSSAVLQKQWYENAKEAYLQAEAALAGVSETDVAYDTLKNNRDALLAEMNEAEEAMLSSAQEAMEAAQEMYTQAIEKAVYDFGQAVSGGIGLDLLQDKYDHYIEEEERYLDKVNEAYEVSAWYAKLQADIDDTSNAKHKETLKALQAEIDARRENNTLSEYDLEILEAKYNVMQAQMALEDAQNAKDQLRLTRDSQGNWNYQYTADAGKIADAEQQLAQATNDWYNIAKQQVEDVTGEIISTWTECQSAIEEIYSDMTLTDEERSARAQEIYKYYTDKIKYLENEKNIAVNDMTAAGNASMLASMMTSSADISDLTGMTAEEVKTMIGNAGDAITSLLIEDEAAVQSIAEAMGNDFGLFENSFTEDLGLMTTNTGNFETFFEQALGNCNDAAIGYEQTIANVADQTGTKVEQLSNKIDEVSDSTDNMKEKGVEAVDAMWDELGKIQGLSEGYADWAEEIMGVIEALEQLAIVQAEDIEDYSEGEGVGTETPSTPSADTGGSGYFAKLNPTAKTPVQNSSDTDKKNLQRALQGAGFYSGEIDGNYPPKKSTATYNAVKKLQKALGVTVDGWYGQNTHKAVMAANSPYRNYLTGGLVDYTGPAWVDGTATKPELMLNASDTANLLTAVDAIRLIGPEVFANIEKILDGGATAGSALMAQKLGLGVSVPSSEGVIEQRVTIEKVEFPGVTSADEINNAFATIVNDAAQWTKRRKD